MQEIVALSGMETSLKDCQMAQSIIKYLFLHLQQVACVSSLLFHAKMTW